MKNHMANKESFMLKCNNLFVNVHEDLKYEKEGIEEKEEP